MAHFRFRFLLAAGAAAVLLLAGCRVSDNKNGKNENVDVSIPFASMHVKTNDDANVAGIGLTRYPGSVPEKNDDDKNNDAADINLSFGSFHLGVKAASYQTSDPPAKVEAFYRSDMARYGQVLDCRGNETIGQPSRTADGLTCADDSHGDHRVHVGHSHDDEELRTGSPTHQHVVSIEPNDGGTKIGLVLLDLPHSDSGGESE